MKNLMFLAVIAMFLTVLISCQEKGIESSLTENDLSVIDPELAAINFTVDEDRLVFDNEAEFQKVIDYLLLNKLSFVEFENQIGFKSLRSRYSSNFSECPIEDEIFATLLNSEQEIIVGEYLFQLDTKSKIISAYYLEDQNCNLKSINLSSCQKFSFNDNVFASLAGESFLKSSYCGQEKVEESYDDGVVAKVDYNKYGIYNSLVSKIYQTFAFAVHFKHSTIDSPLGTVPTGITSRCFYKRDGKQNEIIYSDGYVYANSLQKTLWSNTRRLVGFRLDMEFKWYTDIYSIKTKSLMIECHQY